MNKKTIISVFVLILIVLSLVMYDSGTKSFLTSSDMTIQYIDQNQAYGTPYNSFPSTDFRLYPYSISDTQYAEYTKNYNYCSTKVNSCYKDGVRRTEYEKEYQGSIYFDTYVWCDSGVPDSVVSTCEQASITGYFKYVYVPTQEDICISEGGYWYNNECNEIPIPTKPQPTGIMSWLSGLGDWIINIFNIIGDLL